MMNNTNSNTNTNTNDNLIFNNYKKIVDEINEIKKSNNITNEITLLPVSKTKPYSDLKALKDNNVNIFGENYTKEIIEKYDIDNSLCFHMIGHLQTNKVKQIIGKTALIESADSIKVINVIDKCSKQAGIISDILLEVNVAKEETKFGFMIDEINDVIKEISTLSNIRIKGFMTSAPNTDKPEDNRIYFKELKNKFDEIKNMYKDLDSNVDMEILSMGMSNDYKVAIEEGSTEIRIGTNIFGARNYNK